jgi:hypothetical protein
MAEVEKHRLKKKELERILESGVDDGQNLLENAELQA